MKLVKRLLLLLVALILQTTLIQRFQPLGTCPNLVIVTLFFVCLNAAPFEAMGLGLFAGVLTDILVGRSFGVQTLLCLAVALLCMGAVDKALHNSPLLLALACMVFTFLYYLAYALMSFLFWREELQVETVLQIVFFKSLWNGILALVPAVWLDVRRKRGGVA